LFPSWISTALLFWSFVVATILPIITTLILRKPSIQFSFVRIKQIILDIK